MMALNTRELVDPAFFSRLESIQLRARSIVEGSWQGLHRSPYIGFSVEFSSHREYVPGDDPRHVDWRVFARQRRLYVKEYSAETNMNVYLMLDMSGSMECANTGRSKLHYGAALAAALAHLALKQRDAVGLTLFADEVVSHIAPRAKAHQLDDILHVIAANEARPVSDAAKPSYLNEKAQPGPAPQRIPLQAGGTRLTTELEFREDRIYSIVARAGDGTRLAENRYRVRVRKDQPPQVHFEGPDEALEVHPIAEGLMRVSADDDFGLSKAGVVFQVGNGSV